MLASFTTEQIAVDGAPPVPARIYQAAPARPAPLVLHLRAGSFGGACAAAGRPVAELLAEAGAVVVSADYPAGPGHPFPEALDAMCRLLGQLHARRGSWAARASKLFVAGEEAGGNLAAALAMVARDRLGPPIAGQVLLSPMLDPGMATCSFRDAEAGPVGCKWADGWRAYLGAPDRASHPYAAPGTASRLAGLPPALVLTAADDPMRDDGLHYADRLRAAGVAVRSATLPAPTGWPDALARAAAPGTAWRDAVRAALARFFAAVTPNLVSARI